MTETLDHLWKKYRGLVQGVVGAALVLGLYLVGSWCLERWTEFKIMRADIIFIHPQIEAARREQVKPAPASTPETPAPTTPTEKK